MYSKVIERFGCLQLLKLYGSYLLNMTDSQMLQFSKVCLKWDNTMSLWQQRTSWTSTGNPETKHSVLGFVRLVWPQWPLCTNLNDPVLGEVRFSNCHCFQWHYSWLSDTEKGYCHQHDREFQLAQQWQHWLVYKSRENWLSSCLWTLFPVRYVRTGQWGHYHVYSYRQSTDPPHQIQSFLLFSLTFHHTYILN